MAQLERVSPQAQRNIWTQGQSPVSFQQSVVHRSPISVPELLIFPENLKYVFKCETSLFQVLVITFKSSLLGLKYMCGDGVQLYPPALSYKIHLDVYFKEEVLKSQIWGFNRSWKDFFVSLSKYDLPCRRTQKLRVRGWQNYKGQRKKYNSPRQGITSMHSLSLSYT